MSQIIHTIKYPTRYVAFDNPRCLVIQDNIEHRGGYELAVFHAPIPNSAYPNLVDGLYVEMFSYQGRHIVVESCFTAPDRTRRQHIWRKTFSNDDYQEALACILKAAGITEIP